MKIPSTFDHFETTVVQDFEFTPKAGELPAPFCLVAVELRSGRQWRLWEDDLQRMTVPPFPTGRSTLSITFVGQAEWSCYHTLGWPLPTHVIDTYAEFRNDTNGIFLPHGRSLVGALAHYHLESMGAGEKEAWQTRATQGGPWTPDEREGFLQYCAADVQATARLFLTLAPRLHLTQALFRGYYTKVVSHIEAHGIPIDRALYTTLLGHWDALQSALIARINPLYGFPYDADGSFHHRPLLQWATETGVEWPLTPTRRAVLDKDVLKDLVLLYPQLEPFRQLRKTLGQMRHTGFPVGRDDRNRFLLWPFGTKTGRNTPGTSVNIMGAASWLRSLIQAPPGYGLAYIDWSQQGYGVAAALSHDTGMQLSYRSGDPYLALARMARAVPTWATKRSHGAIREQYKTVSLAVLYGMHSATLARRLGITPAQGAQLLEDHQQAFPTFWAWSRQVVMRANLSHRIQTVLGWRLHCGPHAETNTRSISNFPMQGSGAEMMKIACGYALEAGVHICATVHDALLLLAPLQDLHDAIVTTQRCMTRASEKILHGFPLTTEVHPYPYPDHYIDKRGLPMWALVQEALGDDLLPERLQLKE